MKTIAWIIAIVLIVFAVLGAAIGVAEAAEKFARSIAYYAMVFAFLGLAGWFLEFVVKIIASNLLAELKRIGEYITSFRRSINLASRRWATKRFHKFEQLEYKSSQFRREGKYVRAWWTHRRAMNSL